MSRADALRIADHLRHILEAIDNIQAYTAGTDFATQHASVPWGFAYEMRNALAHGYFNVDLAIVWQTVQNDLPSLKAQVVSLS